MQRNEGETKVILQFLIFPNDLSGVQTSCGSYSTGQGGAWDMPISTERSLDVLLLLGRLEASPTENGET